ncbi:MAG: RsmE family RNA methyltransferase [bacterium]|nr:RsmE family RNA methyltransferase [bacterium]
MPFFLADIKNDRFEVNDVHHIKNVLRMKKGDRIYLSDGIKLYEGIIDQIDKSVKGIVKREFELYKKDLTIYAGIIKYKNMRRLIENVSQAGFRKLVCVETARSMRYDYNRLKKVAIEAAKQSGNFIDLEIKKFDEVITQNFGSKVILDVNAIEFFDKNLISTSDIAFFIGPEGGFSSDELRIAKSYGWRIYKLKNPIIRSENVPLVISGMLM